MSAVRVCREHQVPLPAGTLEGACGKVNRVCGSLRRVPGPSAGPAVVVKGRVGYDKGRTRSAGTSCLTWRVWSTRPGSGGRGWAADARAEARSQPCQACRACIHGVHGRAGDARRSTLNACSVFHQSPSLSLLSTASPSLPLPPRRRAQASAPRPSTPPVVDKPLPECLSRVPKFASIQAGQAESTYSNVSPFLTSCVT